MLLNNGSLEKKKVKFSKPHYGHLYLNKAFVRNVKQMCKLKPN